MDAEKNDKTIIFRFDFVINYSQAKLIETC